jgi:2-polyprenyl-3-methyl-5-hydroxy-6-metoxy-1,4-benzoquinol methylase
MAAQREYEDLLDAEQAAHADDYYDPSAVTQQDWEHYWHRHRERVIRDELAASGVASGARLIELGCGVGTVATYLNESGFCVDYGDVHEQALLDARRRVAQRLGERANDRRFVRLDVAHQPLAPGYDGALLLDVLEHIPDDVLALSNVRKGLEAGGLVLFTVPAFQMLWAPWDDVQRHKRRYTATQARALAEAAGFEVVRTTYFFFPLFFAAGLVKLVRSARNAVLGKPELPSDMGELTEARTNPLINRVMLALLALENPARRKLGLPLGTSILCVARAR